MVNDWVYNSPLFGSVISFLDFLPAQQGYENNLVKVKQLVADGYSIVVFPEGKRSLDGEIGRFHKGAFFLAERLNLDITPIMLHGFSYAMPKYDFFLKNGFADVTTLPRISWDDLKYGEGYKARTKSITSYFKTERQLLIILFYSLYKFFK